MKRNILLLVIVLITTSLFSQKTIWTAQLESVRENGYYNIEVDQRLIGASKHGLQDLRIKNSIDEEVPYFLRSSTSVQEVSSFEDYTLTESIAKDSLNLLIVDNQQKENISRFYIIVGNADVKVKASVRGSNDGKQWYIVKQQSEISVFSEKGRTDAMLSFDFPTGNYRYYEISMQNNQGSPLDVKGVKKLRSSHIYGQFSELLIANKVSVTTKDKQTIISFPDVEDEFVIGKLEFFVGNKIEYLRPFVLKDTLQNIHLASFNLSSKGENVFYLFSDNLKLTKHTQGIIENHNNPPLKIDSVKVYGLERYVCAYLEKDQKYHMEVGREGSSWANYDIEHFKDDISADLPTVKPATVFSSILPEKPIERREELLIEKPIFLWSIIAGVGVLLLVVSVSMVIKMKKRDE